jgi:imidazolonepropionase-like amidohydrolase
VLSAAGVEVALGSDDAHQAGNLPFEAGFARTYGLPEDAALRAVTLVAARLLGVADRVGSIEVGKHADLVVVRGDPFEPLSPLVGVFVGGESVDLRPWEGRAPRTP